MNRLDLTGLTINGVLVVSMSGSRSGKSIWDCRCACGSAFQAVGTSLNSGKTKGCRSCAKASQKASATKHGLVGYREYNSYNAMKARCLNPLDKRYSRYGGRGIAICSRWLESFSNFIADMGMQPTTEHSLERIDVDKGYEPSNCIWATSVVQANNRSNNNLIEINGRIQTIAEWSRETGVNRTVIFQRKQRGVIGTALIKVTIKQGASL